MEKFSVIAIEEVKSEFHAKLVTEIIKKIVPYDTFVAVADVLYIKILDLNTGLLQSYPEPPEAILYWSGKTDIINASWALYDLTNKYDYTDNWNIRKALVKGTPVVISVGNLIQGTVWGSDTNINMVPVSATSPFDLTAGALKNGVIANYSFSNPRFVDYFLDGDYGGTQGTSYAAPRLTGYISQIMDWYPHYGYSQVRTTLEKNSSSIIGKNNKVIDIIIDVKKEVDGTLDAKVLVEDLIEIFQGRNPTDQEVANIVNTIKLKPTGATINLHDNNVAQAFRIYKAAFDRLPDADGLDYWTTQIDRGTSLETVAKQFTDSVEFKTLYGNNLSSVDFITKIYNNVLDRLPDSTGLQYWTNEIKKGKSYSKVLADFSESQENKNNVLPLINNRSSITAWDNADEIITNIAINANLYREDVPLVDQISALYHVFKDREPTVAQLEKWVDRYQSLNEDWGDICNAWMKEEQVKLLGNYDFELNNYQAIVI